MACILVLPLFCILSFYSSMAAGTFHQSNLETYIIHVSMPDAQILAKLGDITSWYLSFLPKPTSSLHESSRIIHSYHNVAVGFATRLTPEEVVSEMEKKTGFIFAKPQKIYTLHTTHFPKFLGLQKNYGVWPISNYGKGMIIGVMDTRITPNHPSFGDEGMHPSLGKCKMKCELNGTMCNNKLIGVRNFVSYLFGLSAIDEEGQNTLTASIATGNFISDANTTRKFGFRDG
ncbi:Cucumisin [Handroanthus impetiginosus]|uniref:Cucumisin n=1 Tax=Handroanthus impetiginosus TaxID=429701 RepID=A0A2G9GRS3_9LAMI|nr:Cucumisin [Handroanthus impetiginosus]